MTSRCVTCSERCAETTRDITPRSLLARLPPSPPPSATLGSFVPQSAHPFLILPSSIFQQPFHPSLLLSLLLLLLIMRASNAPYGHSPTPVKAHRETLADDVSGAVFANDKGVCIPAPLLLQRLETQTQIDTQLGPTITIPASPPSLILSIHASLLLPPTSAFISQLQSVSLSSSQVSSPPLTPVLFPQLP